MLHKDWQFMMVENSWKSIILENQSPVNGWTTPNQSSHSVQHGDSRHSLSLSPSSSASATGRGSTSYRKAGSMAFPSVSSALRRHINPLRRCTLLSPEAMDFPSYQPAGAIDVRDQPLLSIIVDHDSPALLLVNAMVINSWLLLVVVACYLLLRTKMSLVLTILDL